MHVASTERIDGDLGVEVDPVELERRRRSIVDRPWVWCRQVHGDRVIVIGDGPVDGYVGHEADALVTRRDDVALSVQSADCSTLGLWSDDGVAAAVHCGWRGLRAGVIDSTVSAMRASTESPIHAVLGPSIGPECYEFGAAELEDLRSRLGDRVVARTTDGRPALDVRAGVRSTLDRLGIDVVDADDRCTACADDAFHSHRARRDRGRQALVVWIGS